MGKLNCQNKKIHPGITIDPTIWKEFKAKYSTNVSKEVEKLMDQAIRPPIASVQYFSSEPIASVSFENSAQWTINMANNMINVSKTEMSSATTYSSSTANSVDLKDIIIK
jgi:hypothetical protein